MSTEAAANQTIARMLFLHAQTSLHPGSGTALGAVDLPVQRERHTQWPTIPGSALKGILRDRCRETAKASYGGDRKKTNEEAPRLVAAFGPGKISDGSNPHAGALSITDARLLAFPVRSLRGVFAWVTCPEVLRRLTRDLRLAEMPGPPAPPELLDGQALAAEKPLRVGEQIVLEEFDFRCIGTPGDTAEWLGLRVSDDPTTQKRLRTHLAVLSDNDFTHFVRHATEIVARIALDYEHKTVKDGALFYQEFLPAETLFYSVVLANNSRSDKQTAAEVLAYLADHLRKDTVLQIGGDETTGKGLCLVRLSDGKEA